MEARPLLATIVDLGPAVDISNGEGINNVTGINSTDEVAGSVYTGVLSPATQVESFLLDGNGVTHDVDPLPGYYKSFANAVGDAGQVVGDCNNGSEGMGLPPSAAFVYSQGTLTNLGTLGGNVSVATGINASGAIVGYSATTGSFSNPIHAVYWSPGSTSPEDLGTLGGSTSEATGINASGQIVGYSETATGSLTHAFLLNPGSPMEDLGTLGGSMSEATGINASGQVVGYSATSTSPRSPVDAFLWSPGTGMQDLGTLYGYVDCYATAINKSGVVAGYVTDEGLPGYAFIYENGQMKDLNSLLPSNSGWVLETATAINDQGVVVGMGAFTAPSTAMSFSPRPRRRRHCRLRPHQPQHRRQRPPQHRFRLLLLHRLRLLVPGLRVRGLPARGRS